MNIFFPTRTALRTKLAQIKARNPKTDWKSKDNGADAPKGKRWALTKTFTVPSEPVEDRNARIRGMIAAAGSNFASVTFTKKTTGEARTITFNPLEDKKANKLKTGGNAQAVATRKANNPTLINVVDSSVANKEEDRRNGWRSFGTETVTSMKINGKEYIFEPVQS